MGESLTLFETEAYPSRAGQPAVEPVKAVAMRPANEPPPSLRSGVFPTRPLTFRCAECGETRALVDLYGDPRQLGMFSRCAPCAAPEARTKASKGQVARAAVADAEAGRTTVRAAAAALEGHVAARTLVRAARRSTIRQPGEHEAPGYWRAIGRLLLPYLATPRSWGELEAFAADLGWELGEGIRNVVVYLERVGDVEAVRVDEDSWAWRAAPEEDAADESGEWWASLPAATLHGAGHTGGQRP